MSFQLIGHYEVGSGGITTIEFTDIPQDGNDLMLYFSIRSNDSSDFQSASVYANTYNTGTYERFTLQGNGDSANSGYVSSDTEVYVGPLNAATSTGNVFSSGKVFIADYTGSQNKNFGVDFVSEEAQAYPAYQQFTTYAWNQTSAITSLGIQVYGRSDDLVQYSTASLYKITSGSDGITTVS